MHYERNLIVQGDLEDVREATRAWYLGQGYHLADETVEGFSFVRRKTPGGLFGFRIERRPTHLHVDLGALSEGEDGSPRALIRLDYRIRTGMHVVTRIDYLFYRTEVDCLERYIADGVRFDPSTRLKALRRPVAAAIWVNVAMASLLIAIVGILAGFGGVALTLVAMSVALVNMISILGFADVVIQGVEALGD